ncbi:unnamed protein product [Dibothriocephalus latus]|uniref:Uncharacterized protein n=1 Tax=Dibothriocephalus latus TaxID=60516 RepID=A0A3P7L3W3_DIBLA|nr:unnamed protein product [Dibothriocephalus latus]
MSTDRPTENETLSTASSTENNILFTEQLPNKVTLSTETSAEKKTTSTEEPTEKKTLNVEIPPEWLLYKDIHYNRYCARQNVTKTAYGYASVIQQLNWFMDDKEQASTRL